MRSILKQQGMWKAGLRMKNIRRRQFSEGSGKVIYKQLGDSGHIQRRGSAEDAIQKIFDLESESPSVR